MRCCVKGCKSVAGAKYPGISFFHFPKSPSRALQWLRRIGGDEKCLKKRICSLHFEDEHLLRCASRKFLKPFAMPKYLSIEVVDCQAEPIFDTGTTVVNFRDIPGTSAVKQDIEINLPHRELPLATFALHDDQIPSYAYESENDSHEMYVDPMTIDSYQTALSYFRPLEQFILAKQDNRVLAMTSQLRKLLLKIAASEEEQEKDMTEDDQKIPVIVSEVTIEGYEDALRYIQPLGEFLLDNENIRAVGLINQLEMLLSNK